MFFFFFCHKIPQTIRGRGLRQRYRVTWVAYVTHAEVCWHPAPLISCGVYKQLENTLFTRLRRSEKQEECVHGCFKDSSNRRLSL